MFSVKRDIKRLKSKRRPKNKIIKLVAKRFPEIQTVPYEVIHPMFKAVHFSWSAEALWNNMRLHEPLKVITFLRWRKHVTEKNPRDIRLTLRSSNTGRSSKCRKSKCRKKKCRNTKCRKTKNVEITKCRKKKCRNPSPESQILLNGERIFSKNASA